MSIKPIMTSVQLIDKMKSKGIKFSIMNEETAIDYLNSHSNYFRVASYRKNYDKHIKGQDKGKYIDLEFAYLSELSTIDMHLRFLILKMCLDLEHSLKVNLVNDIANNEAEDGYDIVDSFLKKDRWSWMVGDIFNKRCSPYNKLLIEKFFHFETHKNEFGKEIVDSYTCKCPVWAFMEIITFGQFISFYSFYYETYPAEKNIIGTLNAVKSLRNICAHNNCLIYDLRKGRTKATKLISDFVTNIPNISKNERKQRLSVRPIFEIVSLLYLYDATVFEPVKTHRFQELNKIVNERMVRNKSYFKQQPIISSSYIFLKKVVDFLA